MSKQLTLTAQPTLLVYFIIPSYSIIVLFIQHVVHVENVYLYYGQDINKLVSIEVDYFEVSLRILYSESIVQNRACCQW